MNVQVFTFRDQMWRNFGEFGKVAASNKQDRGGWYRGDSDDDLKLYSDYYTSSDEDHSDSHSNSDDDF